MMRAEVTTLVAFALLGATAGADPSAAKAEVLFRQGRDLMAAGKLAEACGAFDASQKLDPATTTLFNQADCREKNNQIATAWGLFVEAERKTRGASDDTGAKMHKVAQTRAAKLEARVSNLTVNVGSPPDGLVVLRDGAPIDRGEWNHPLPIDGGTYAFTAKLGDREVWSETVTVAPERAKQTVDVVVRRVPTAPPTVGAAIPEAGAPEPPRDRPVGPAAHASRTGAWVFTAGSVVLLGSALGFHLWGNSTYDDAVTNHDQDEWTSANHLRYAAQGFLAGGVVCAGVATYLWLKKSPESARVSSRTVVTPALAEGYAGLGVVGAW